MYLKPQNSKDGMNNVRNRQPSGSNAKNSISHRRERKDAYIAFLLGVSVLVISIILGKSSILILSFLGFSFLIALLWRRSYRPWIYLASMMSATPIAITRFKLNGNILFSLWYILFHPTNLFRLPKWIYIPSALTLLGLMTSSVNWMSHGHEYGLMRQVTYAFNLFFGPFLLLPAIYLRMKGSESHYANLKGLLFFIILPSTLILLAAKLFGTVANAWDAAQHAQSLPQGFLLYKLGNGYINFLRTQVGFILAAMICATTAIVSTPVEWKYKWLALFCLCANVFMLLSTASIGSAASCILGLCVIFFIQAHKISLGKVIASLFVLCLSLVLIYTVLPSDTKQYLEKRVEHRVVNKNVDRITLWGWGFDRLLEHPEGSGLTLKGITDQFIHNDYIVYMVSYGFIGGLGYLVLIIGVITAFWKRRRRIQKHPAALAIYLAGLGTVVALAFNSITDHSNENRWYFNVIWTIIWYCYFCSYPVKKTSLHENNSLYSHDENQIQSPPGRHLGFGNTNQGSLGNKSLQSGLHKPIRETSRGNP